MRENDLDYDDEDGDDGDGDDDDDDNGVCRQSVLYREVITGFLCTIFDARYYLYRSVPFRLDASDVGSIIRYRARNLRYARFRRRGLLRRATESRLGIFLF